MRVKNSITITESETRKSQRLKQSTILTGKGGDELDFDFILKKARRKIIRDTKIFSLIDIAI